MRRILATSLQICFVLFAWSAVGCSRGSSVDATSPAAEASALEARIDTAIRRATAYLEKTQAADGAWRSDVYAPFKAGDALTPPVLAALAALPDSLRPPNAWQRGQAYLSQMVDDAGTIRPPRHGVAYPVYAAACSLIALSDRGAEAQSARRAWIEYLRARQLTEASGWTAEDPFYGGWGYAADLPEKPAPGVPVGPLLEPNLSATAYALAALRMAGVEPTAPTIAKARQFVERCQNFAPAEATGDAVNDGGFFFVLDDPVRNKAGVAGQDTDGRYRFHSYGSTTADGVRCYLALGMTPDEPRLAAAWAWLGERFSATQNPGQFADNRQAERNSVYFYYLNSLAEALVAAGNTVPTEVDTRSWAMAIAEALVACQQADGRWENEEVEVRENDPLVATALALRALALCRQQILVELPADKEGLSLNDRSESAHPPAKHQR